MQLLYHNSHDNLFHNNTNITCGEELQRLVKQVMHVSHHSILSQDDPVLLASMHVRNPKVDALNFLQALILRRLRSGLFSSHAERKVLRDSLLVSINGVAAGMRNTG